MLVAADPPVTRVADITREHIEAYKTWLATRPGYRGQPLSKTTLGMRLGHWLEDTANRRRVVELGTTLGSSALSRLRDDDVRGLMTDVLLPRLRSEELSPILGTLLEGVVADGAPADVLTVDTLADVFRLRAEVVTDPVTGGVLVVPDHPIAGPAPV